MAYIVQADIVYIVYIYVHIDGIESISNETISNDMIQYDMMADTWYDVM